MKLTKWGLGVALALGLCSAAQAACDTRARPRPALHVGRDPATGKQSLLGPKGARVTLRGASIIPPEQTFECKTCNARDTRETIGLLSDRARGWNADVVRIPITTKYARDPATAYAKYIKPNVTKAKQCGLYAIVDLHYVADFGGSSDPSQAYLLQFWSYVAKRYANDPNVLFELFNEPLNPDDWAAWKAFISPVVDAVRAQTDARGAPARNVILIGSPQWDTRIPQAAADPLPQANLVYVEHIYPNQGPATAANLDAKFGSYTGKIAVMVTEFGWNPKSTTFSDNVSAGTTSGWGQPFARYMDRRPEISWTSWIFDNFWKPQYFDNDWRLLTGEYQGDYMRRWFAAAAAGRPTPAPQVAEGEARGRPSKQSHRR
jgi:hypothetical protein